VAVAADDRAVRAALLRRLNHFVSSDRHAPDVTFEIVTVGEANEHDLPEPPSAARPVYESSLGDVLYLDAADQLFLNVGADVRVVAEAGLGRVRASLRGAIEQHLWLMTHPLFTLPLMECLKRRSLYSVHAAGLAIDGRGLLLAGTSGAGKSTLAVALLRVGLEFMGDDMLFMAPTTNGVRLLAFPDEIDITEHTAHLFPELAWVLGPPRATGWPKWSCSVDELGAARVRGTCRPAVLVFPRVSSSTHSTLVPLPADEALVELTPNVLLTEGTSSAAHFGVLADLARTCTCYRLDTGRDFDDIVRGLSRLLME
jgi:hypothetical protein